MTVRSTAQLQSHHCFVLLLESQHYGAKFVSYRIDSIRSTIIDGRRKRPRRPMTSINIEKLHNKEQRATSGDQDN